MNAMRVALFLLAAAPAIHAQGIRGVTRRTPTVVYGQQPAQFFAASGLMLNTPTNVGTIPGAPNNQRLVGQPYGVPANTLANNPQPAQQNVPKTASRPVPLPASRPTLTPR